MKLVTAAEMREIERQVFARGLSAEQLMRRAGTAVAWAIQTRVPEGAVLVLAGPGNNGGDGLYAADILLSMGRDVYIYSVNRTEFDPYTGPVQAAESDPDGSALEAALQRSAVVIDALLGIGRSRPLGGSFARVIEQCNMSQRTYLRVAVDIPTGVDTDTGTVAGTTFRADVTVTFGLCKRGIALAPGREYAGEVVVCDLDMRSWLADDVKVDSVEANEVVAILPKRTMEANKGSSGKLLLVAGSQEFMGAPALCASAAYRSGAGLVELAVIPPVQPSVAAHVPECVFTLLPEKDGKVAPAAAEIVKGRLAKVRVVAIGPGLGLSNGTVDFMKRLLAVVQEVGPDGIIFDADALNALSQIPEWWEGLDRVVITPHPGEMARLSGMSIKDVQSDRVSCAQHHAQKWGVTVVLKGAGTVIASPQGRASINPTGGPNLATAGTGDILTGILAGFMAQGLSSIDAAKAGVYIHGLSGDLLRKEHGDIGTVAGDLPPVIPRAVLALTRNG